MRTLLLTLTTCLLVLPVQAKYSGGSGTAQDHYQIATAADLIALGETPGDYDKHFLLTADIDLDPNLPGRKVFDKAVIAPDTDPTKEYFQGTPFTGVFDGNGHVISLLTIEGAGYLGLFGQLAPGAEVRHLGLLNVVITGSGGRVAGLAGANGTWSNTRAAIVTDCYSTGTVAGAGADVGGLVGVNYGRVTRSYTIGSVKGNDNVGGLVGWNYHQRGDPMTQVTYCYSTCVVAGGAAGGLVGENDGAITCCYATGAVSGGWVGGLVGNNEGDVTCCFSAGKVGGTGNWARVGGLVGENDQATVIHSFWDTQTSGQAASAAGTGRTTAEMQTSATFLNAGWDFLGERQNGLHEIWQMPQGDGYPVLAVLSGYGRLPLQGVGTPDDPYLISDALELGAMIHYSPNARYRLAASIDLSGIHWATPVVPAFEGTFDGNGFTISHLTITGKDYLGLFGILASGAEVRTLGVLDVNIVGSGGCIGGLVGENDHGSVSQCHSTGSVEGKYAVGGLVGQNYYYGGLTHCHSAGVASGSYDVGGMVGLNYGVVGQCYSGVVVSGDSTIGGLVGYNCGDLTHCYSTGAVSGANSWFGGLVGRQPGAGDEIPPGIVVACFWDIQTSGQATSDGGTGKSTAQMHDPNTFKAAGWDFVGEADGLHENWQMPEGGGYPILAVLSGYVPPHLTGLGTQENPYLITDARELGAVVYHNPDAYYRLAASIDLSGITWGLVLHYS